MERLSIIGDFFDCQLYDGRLYLWTFGGAVQVYDYRKIMDYWSRHQEDQESGWGDETGWAEIIITQDSLKRFLNYERDYFTSEFPVGTEVLDRELYEANAAGLFKCQLPVCERRERAIQITDAPMISVKRAKKRGIVCAAGSDGLFWLPVDSDFGNIFHIVNIKK